TMSIHIKEGCSIKAKKGMPGEWKYVEIAKETLDREAVKELAKAVTEETSTRTDGFIEVDRRGSTIIQLANYRIVITRPPFADGYEITAVKPIKKLSLSEYKLNEKIQKRIEGKAEGILIAGAPGHGKTTFAQALAEHYLKKKKVIKTIESPRDLTLSDEVTQYSMNYGSSQEIHDILLLSRPDYTIFDEMRNTVDFRLFSDLRLSGVGMIGVIHATKPIDAIQRFIGRIELGVIPHIIDTVIFITNGAIDRIFSLNMEVKVPSGMTEADLARPVVIVNDFNTGRLEFEIYTYGEQTVVIPVGPGQSTPARKLAEETIKNEISRYASKAQVEMLSDNKCRVYVPLGGKSRLIGRQGQTIDAIEDKLGLSIEVIEGAQKKHDKREERTDTLPYQVKIDKRNILLRLSPENAYKEVDIYLGGDYLLSATASKKSIIKIIKFNKIGRIILKAVQAGEQLEVRGSS
nr:Flp pilus assembly complex ATPase component TadA [Nanoarchaeota archaeon]